MPIVLVAAFGYFAASSRRLRTSVTEALLADIAAGQKPQTRSHGI
jgi:hypothetical protein